jgi:hypothetical protein
MHGSESAIGKTIKHDLNLDKDFDLDKEKELTFAP